ncbi:MAG TPA: hypothetical protein VGY66_23460 [Gemmataceae bacterium]|jgi:predicted transposase YdaD|nr:hypothetical protein [Gemmataceae bacterium]
MSLPFDAAGKDLLETYPRDWLVQLDISQGGGVEVIEAELSTVSAQADKVLRIQDANAWLLHLELQSSRDRQLARRLLKYNVLLHERHELPVHSVVVLLRREAEDPGMTGLIQYQPPSGHGSLDFRFQVLRVWQQPLAKLLDGGLGTLPLAPLTDEAEPMLPAVIDRLKDRISHEATPGEEAKLWTSTFILMGLRYTREVATELLQGVQAMKESATYQAILDEGRIEGRAEGAVQGAVQASKKILLALGNKRYGMPSARNLSAIEAITSVSRLEQLVTRIHDVATWDDLLSS